MILTPPAPLERVFEEVGVPLVDNVPFTLSDNPPEMEEVLESARGGMGSRPRPRQPDGGVVEETTFHNPRISASPSRWWRGIAFPVKFAPGARSTESISRICILFSTE